MERIKSGIPGLEKITGGGIPRYHSVLICGAPGTGKTIFALQFLYNGAKLYGENGLYISVEEDPFKLKGYAKEFGWSDIDTLEQQGKLTFMRVHADERKFDIVDRVREHVQKTGAKRLVVDSLTAIYLAFEDITQFVYSFINLLNELKLTSIFITDAPAEGTALTRDGISEYVCDGVILVQLNDTSQNVSRTLSIKKMRGTAITPGQKSLKFTRKGLELEDFKAFY
jgi:circadian clock protein KaiC